MISFTTKLPAPELFPNRKNGTHWTLTNKVKKEDQKFGYYSALPFKNIFFIKTDSIHMTIDFYYGNKRKRDLDNCLAATKALQDGIFLALGIDDSQIIKVTISKNYDKQNPRCAITLALM
jgi:Holliday junction resolvase RusA-like endonuclease